MAARTVMLDTETTGFSPVTDRIVEFAAIEMEPRTGRAGRQIHHLINPERSIPEAAARVHGITGADVHDKPRFATVADGILSFLRGTTLAIHNSAFDVRMLDAELARAGRPPLRELGVTIVDTLALAKDVYPLLPRHSLDALCDHVGVSRAERERHGALTDARLLGACVTHMAADYDRWVSAPDHSCACDAGGTLQHLREACATVAGEDRPGCAERADAGLAGVATAMQTIAGWSGTLADRCAALTGERDWSSKHFVVRWVSSEHVSWKAAAKGLLAGTDLGAFTKDILSTTLAPAPMDEVAGRLLAFDGTFGGMRSCPAPACIVGTMMHLDELAETLAARREELRKTLLRFVKDGYRPRFAHVRTTTRNVVDFRRAVRALAPGADLSAFQTLKSSLKVRRRNPEACRLLFN